MTRLSKTPIEFKDAKTPFSPVYDDFYFSKQDGVDESSYVYLEGAGVKTAILQKQKSITVAEIGFGFGINLLLTLKQFKETAELSQTLHYISAEKYPIEVADLRSLHSAYPELVFYSELLLAQYPCLTPGLHRLFFFDGKFIVDLLVGDALEQFQELEFKANHWYWDGFAPSKNPDAFSEALFQEVARLSAPGAKGASYTSAGWVRRTIEENGFVISKRTGFGGKRECIVGLFDETKIKVNLGKKQKTPWFSSENLPKLLSGQTVAILGAGLAGTALARTLADRGFRVSVFDGHGIAGRASSNSVGLFDVQLSKLPNPLSRFAQASFTHFSRELNRLKVPHRFGILKGETDALQSLQNSGYPESFFSLQGESVFYPESGMLSPSKLCELRLEHPFITFVEAEVKDIKEIQTFNHVVYALGADYTLRDTTLYHPHLSALPFRAIRGQTLLVRPNEESRKLETVKVHDGYVSPLAPEITGHELHLIGATYQAKDISGDQEERDSAALINEAKAKWPEFKSLSLSDVISTKVGYRLSTPDKLPVIGPLCDPEYLKKHYAHALKGSHHNPLQPLQIPSNEWIMMGFGSRGITFSALSAEILVSLMTGFPLPIEANLVPHLHSARFFVRNLRKSKVK